VSRVRQKNIAALGFLLALTACTGAGTEANRTTMPSNRVALPGNIGPIYGSRWPENPTGIGTVAENRASERDLQQRLAALEQSLVEQRAALERLSLSRAEAEPLPNADVTRPVPASWQFPQEEPPRVLRHEDVLARIQALSQNRESPAQRVRYEDIVAQFEARNRVDDPMRRVYQAYREGRMTTEDAAKFEEEVRAGRIMLARGEGLIGENVSPSEYRPPIAPVVNSIPANQGVLDAYTQGRMTPEDRIKFERFVRNGTITVPPGFQLGPSAPTGAQTAPPPAPASQPAASAQTARLQSELDALERDHRAAASRAGRPSTEQVQSLERRAIELETALQRFGRI
jgi:hypothetical protein